MKSLQISDNLTIGSQPDQDEIKQLKQQGFRSVVNLRVENEEDEMLSPISEGEMVRAADMTYLHLPVNGKDMRSQQVDDFRQCIQNMEGPVFVHCQAGKRAGAFALMHEGVQQKWSGKQTLEAAQQRGLECDQPQLKKFVSEYVDNHRS